MRLWRILADYQIQKQTLRLIATEQASGMGDTGSPAVRPKPSQPDLIWLMITLKRGE